MSIGSGSAVSKCMFIENYLDDVKNAYFKTYGLDTKGACEELLDASDGCITMEKCEKLAEIIGTGTDAIITDEKKAELMQRGFGGVFIDGLAGSDGKKLFNERLEWLKENIVTRWWRADYSLNNRVDMVKELGEMGELDAIPVLAEAFYDRYDGLYRSCDVVQALASIVWYYPKTGLDTVCDAMKEASGNHPYFSCHDVSTSIAIRTFKMGSYDQISQLFKLGAASKSLIDVLGGDGTPAALELLTKIAQGDSGLKDYAIQTIGLIVRGKTDLRPVYYKLATALLFSLANQGNLTAIDEIGKIGSDTSEVYLKGLMRSTDVQIRERAKMWLKDILETNSLSTNGADEDFGINVDTLFALRQASAGDYTFATTLVKDGMFNDRLLNGLAQIATEQSLDILAWAADNVPSKKIEAIKAIGTMLRSLSPNNVVYNLCEGVLFSFALRGSINAVDELGVDGRAMALEALKLLKNKSADASVKERAGAWIDNINK